MNDDQNYFFYPEDLKQKSQIGGWTIPNLIIIVASLFISALIFFFTFVMIPFMLVILYAILTLRYKDFSLATLLRDYFNYLFLDQLEYTWGEPEPLPGKVDYDEN